MTRQVADILLEELQSLLSAMSRDFERIEILAAALAAFNRPVPDYEPMFRHLGHAALGEHDLGEIARNG